VNLLFAIKSLNVVGGGAERVLVDVANGLTERGHIVEVLTFDTPGLPSFYPLHPGVRRLDTGIGEPGHPTPRTRFLQAIPQVRRRIIDAKADLVVAFMHSTYVPITAALLGTGARVVVSEHVNATHYRSRPLQRALVWAADQLAVAKTVPATPSRERPVRTLGQNVHVLPNAINLAVFEHVRHVAPRQPPTLLSVGRFMEEKNHIDLLRAFARVRLAHPEWTLRLVGEGVLRPMLEEQVRKLGLGDCVQMPGVSRDVAGEYAAASIVALPSLYESFGMVAAEALASGRTVVAFDCCVGIAEMVRSGINGLLVAAKGDRVANLAAGLECLMSDGALRQRLAAAGPDSVGRFAVDTVLNAWEQLLTQLCARPTR
jgi:GalNAc-alpha-(1->4)-GalNAc-alpha-(1->3)-diNAcBac-PP-undecaprenol alpha-1,4-N-acetyl-D-galactosaminyltransferase